MKMKWKNLMLFCALALGVVMFASCKDDDDDTKKDDGRTTTEQSKLTLPTFADLSAYVGKTNNDCTSEMEKAGFSYLKSMEEDGMSMAIFLKPQDKDTLGYMFVSAYNMVVGAYYFTSTTDKKSAMELVPTLSAQAFVFMDGVNLSDEDYEGFYFMGGKQYDVENHQQYLSEINKVGTSDLQGAVEMIFAQHDLQMSMSGVIPGSLKDLLFDGDDDEDEDFDLSLLNSPQVYVMLGCANPGALMQPNMPFMAKKKAMVL